MHFHVAFGTDVGRKREKNQDNGGAFPELGLYVVADGMGGHRGGETASQMVVELVPEIIRAIQKKGPFDSKIALQKAIEKASEAIYQRSQNDPELRGMGTTTVAALVQEDQLVIGHVGDSRAYYIRPDGIWQLTRDHSLVQEKLRAGIINREQVKTDRMKNVITRSVGFEDMVDVDVYEFEIHEGDIFLLCSDGLSGQLEDKEMLQIVQDGLIERKDIESTIHMLIDAANETGGDDNISALLFQAVGK